MFTLVHGGQDHLVLPFFVVEAMRYYRASQIYTTPRREFKKATKTEPAVMPRAGRVGILPIGRTAFYAMLKCGEFPEADSRIGSTRLWSDELIRTAVEPTKAPIEGVEYTYIDGAED